MGLERCEQQHLGGVGWGVGGVSMAQSIFSHTGDAEWIQLRVELSGPTSVDTLTQMTFLNPDNF